MATMGRPATNKHRVAASRWRTWSEPARRVFNTVYEEMRPENQSYYTHPQAVLMPKTHWETLRWNVAWEAADAADTK